MTVADFELETTTPREFAPVKRKAALEVAGVIFVEENGKGSGARLRKQDTDMRVPSL